MSISETCGSCGSSVELDRVDEVELWQVWRESHKCVTRVTESFFSSAATQVEATTIGFAPAEHPGRRDTGLDDE